jgi:tellurite resistance protein TehA-like permease
VRPDAFAAVMATGIVSIAAEDHGYHVVGGVLAVLAAAALVVLIVAGVIAWRREPLDFSQPEAPIQLLTFVAACAVVGTRFVWAASVHFALGMLALLGWLLLMPLVVRAMWRCRWTGLRDRARGGGELVSVATSGLAIIAADLRWVGLSIALLVLAVCVYCLMTGLVLWRAGQEPAAVELRAPDVWILMGGVAIATLAGDHIHRAGFRAIEPATVVTWIVASLWIPVLVMVSLRLRDGNWWAAVFPLGMYSSATFATAVETGWRPLATVSLVFFWIALAAWLVVTGRECATLYARRGVSRTQLRGRRRDR